MKQPVKNELTFEALGTNWWIQAALDKKVEDVITKTITDFDNRWSRFKKDSLVSTMRHQAGSYPISSREYELLRFYESLAEITNNSMTPLVGQALEELGYDADYSLREKSDRRYQAKAWNDVIELSETTVTLKQPALLDIGAAGKGFAVDQIAQLLTGDYIVDASGDMIVSGKATIGLQHPIDHTKVIGHIEIENAAMCASSIYVRAWGSHHHIVDTRTNQSVQHVVATWAMADSAMQADGFASALFFVEPELLVESGLNDYCIVYADNSLRLHPQTKVQLFTV